MTQPAHFLVAVDQGTTSTRALVIDSRGQVAGTSQGSFKIPGIHPQPGWVELEPWHIWDTVRDAVCSAVAHAGIRFDQIAGLGIANQGETVIAFDAATGEPFGRAISWQDRRADSLVEEWRDRGMAGEVEAVTGLRLDSYFSAPKLAWILAHDNRAAAARERGTLRLGTSDSWLLWQLTGGQAFITDAATASRTMLLDLKTRDWSDDLLHAFAIPRQALPAITANAGDLAVTHKSIFGREIPITGLCVDQHAALFGHGCRRIHQAKATYGTGCFFLANAGTDPGVRAPGLITALGWHLVGRTHYVLEGGVYSAGAIVEWLVRLGLLADPAEVDMLCGQVSDTRGVAMVPALSGLAAPHWNSDARAAWLAMDSGCERGHLVRAAVESIAYRVREIAGAMAGAGITLDSLRADGGLTRSRFLMQYQADVLTCPVEVCEATEITALGVGLMAGLGADIWSGFDELPRVAAIGERFMPRDTHTAAGYYQWWREQVAQVIPDANHDD